MEQHGFMLSKATSLRNESVTFTGDDMYHSHSGVIIENLSEHTAKAVS